MRLHAVQVRMLLRFHAMPARERTADSLSPSIPTNGEGDASCCNVHERTRANGSDHPPLQPA